MGMTIHYGGQIKSTDLIDELCDEVEDICKTMGWTYHHMEICEDISGDIAHLLELDNETQLKVRGIHFQLQEKSESVMYFFDQKGRLFSNYGLMFLDELKSQLPVFTSFTKTQSLGAQKHIALVKLMKYFADKYFSTFKVTDESDYWETGDEQLCIEKFEALQVAIDLFKGIIEKNIDQLENKTPDEIVSKIVDLLKGRMGEREEE